MAPARSLPPHLGKPQARARRRLKRLRASLGAVAGLAGRKESKNGVADNVQHLAPLLHHGTRRAIEIGVQQIEKFIDGERVSQPRGVAQIAVPERRGQPLAIAALDGARQDRPPTRFRGTY